MEGCKCINSMFSYANLSSLFPPPNSQLSILNELLQRLSPPLAFNNAPAHNHDNTRIVVWELGDSVYAFRMEQGHLSSTCPTLCHTQEKHKYETAPGVKKRERKVHILYHQGRKEVVNQCRSGSPATVSTPPPPKGRSRAFVSSPLRILTLNFHFFYRTRAAEVQVQVEAFLVTKASEILSTRHIYQR